MYKDIPRDEARSTTRDFVNRLIFGIFESSRWRALAAVAFMAGVSLTEGLSVLLLLPLLQIAGVDVQSNSLDRISVPIKGMFSVTGIHPTLVAVLTAYILATALQASLIRVQSLFDVNIVQDYTQHLRVRLYRAIAAAKWLALTRVRSSDLTFALTTAADRVASAAHQILYVGSNGAVAAIYVILALVVSPGMSAIVLPAAILLLLSQWSRTRGARIPGEELDESTSSLYATAAEQLGGLKTAKSYGNEERHLEAFLENGLRVNEAGLALARIYAALKWRQSVGAVIALCGILFLAVRVFHLPTAALLLLLFLFSRLVPRLVTIQQTIQYVVGALPALRTIESLIDSCERSVERPPGQQIPIEPGRIEVQSLSLTYTDKQAPALSDVTLQIPEAQTTAIIGSSGSGKTTLADVLLGLIRPDNGDVMVGSVPLDPSHLKSWRSHIGYVAQDTYLFNESVRANLKWAHPNASEQEMRESLHQAAADEFVDRLPQGIDTIIGERGVRLSGGEKQRLSLARALLRKPRVLILDEATSALDSENEQRIYGAIDRLHGEMTIIIITHRLSTIRTADIIHVMSEGRVVASGTWDALMSGDNARFRELTAAQGIR